MSIQGKTIVFTGKISKPRHEFQKLVEEHGGIAGSDVSRSTDYLVVGDKPGSKLFRAGMLGVKTISEAEFLKLLEETQDETPLTKEKLNEINSHFIDKTCYFCGGTTKQFDTWVDTDTCFLCETRDTPECPKCHHKYSYWVSDFKTYHCNNCGNWFKAPNSRNAFTISHLHFWFRTETKSNGDIVRNCLCGTVLIDHPDGTWEKHEPKNIIEKTMREAHEHAVEEERLYHEKLKEEKGKEKEIFDFIESITPEQRDQLRREYAKL